MAGTRQVNRNDKPSPKEAKSLNRKIWASNPRLDVVHPDAAGIDVGNSEHYVAIAPEKTGESVQRFGCFTGDLHRLVRSRLGAHPDARAASLQRMWRLEEHVRAGGAPTLTLRFAPLVGPETPLWRKLRARPSLPKGGRKLVNPVAETDAVETLVRALDGRGPWRGWYEVAGADTLSLAELRELAAHTPGATRGGAWEPSLEEIREHRLAESQPWAAEFGIAPTPLAAWAGATVA